jgi:hypothetical protein
MGHGSNRQHGACCTEERKFFFVAPQRKLSFSKAQLRSLRFKLLDTTLLLWLDLVWWYLFRAWWLSPALGNLKTRVRILRNYELTWLRNFLFNEVAVAFFAHENFLWKLAFLALIVVALCTINSSKSTIALCVLRSCFKNCVLLLRRNIFKVARPTMAIGR